MTAEDDKSNSFEIYTLRRKVYVVAPTLTLNLE
jgi:hypothetical protein